MQKDHKMNYLQSSIFKEQYSSFLLDEHEYEKDFPYSCSVDSKERFDIANQVLRIKRKHKVQPGFLISMFYLLLSNYLIYLQNNTTRYNYEEKNGKFK